MFKYLSIFNKNKVANLPITGKELLLYDLNYIILQSERFVLYVYSLYLLCFEKGRSRRTVILFLRACIKYNTLPIIQALIPSTDVIRNNPKLQSCPLFSWLRQLKLCISNILPHFATM